MAKEEKKSNIKKSLILSGLVGTFGLFAAKALGLVYSIPLSSILGSDAYMSYYGTAYRIYSYILNVFTAGFPFAIATLVARYTVKDDNQTLLNIKKLSHIVMAVTGLAGMLLMILISGPMAGLVAPKEDFETMQMVLCILSLSVFFVPTLSAFRGFYQGRKEMKEYAFSQAFEQFFRVGFLLSVSYLLVYVMNQDRKYALYVAVLSTSIAAIAAILQFWFFDRRKGKEIREAAKVQEAPSIERNDLLKEFFALSIPYLLVAVMGYSDDIFNSVLLPVGLRMHGYSEEVHSVILSAYNYVGAKLIAIPMILAPGFTSALIPHISASLEEGNYKKISANVRDCLNIIFYIGLPVSFCIGLYAKELYQLLFYTSDIATSSVVLRWVAVEGFFGTITPVVTNIMMALELRKNVLKRLLVALIIKGIIMVPLIWLLGFPGAVLSTVISYSYLIIMNFINIHNEYQINFKNMIRKLIKIIITLVIITGVKLLLDMIGLNAANGSKLMCLIKLFINGGIVVLVYVGLTAFMRIPQTIFHVKLSGLLKRKRNAASDAQ